MFYLLKKLLFVIERLTWSQLLYLTMQSVWFESRVWWGVLDTTLSEKDYLWLASGLWFSSCTPVSSTNKTCHHDISEILLKVTLNMIILTSIPAKAVSFILPLVDVLDTILCVTVYTWLETGWCFYLDIPPTTSLFNWYGNKTEAHR